MRFMYLMCIWYMCIMYLIHVSDIMYLIHVYLMIQLFLHLRHPLLIKYLFLSFLWLTYPKMVIFFFKTTSGVMFQKSPPYSNSSPSHVHIPHLEICVLFFQTRFICTCHSNLVYHIEVVCPCPHITTLGWNNLFAPEPGCLWRAETLESCSHLYL